jgi:hypothetical protein
MRKWLTLLSNSAWSGTEERRQRSLPTLFNS